MDTSVRQLARHAAVFGVGAIVSRLASIVLLPLYTRHLTPGDYGVIAIIDLTVNLLGILAGAGVVSAAMREHCTDPTPSHHDRVWWTALVVVAVVASIVFAPALALRTSLADALFGPAVPDGRYYLALGLSTLWVSTLLFVLESYCRARRDSGFLATLSVGRLLLNVALNVVLVVWMRQGIAGILWGNLITVVVVCLILLGMFLRSRGRFVFEPRLVRPYWAFGWPLVMFALLSAFMHEADRYILRVFLDLREVGLYSIAYQIGQGVNTLVIAPFTAIWHVLVYEVAQRADARLVYARVFRHMTYGLALIMLAASLSAETVIRLLAPPEYAPAAELVPIICLAYLFFSMHEHFKVPALITGRTTALLPVVAIAACTNIALNLLLIPALGARGAAWATVLTFVVFSFAGLVQYRRVEKYPYPFLSCAVVLSAMAATYIGYRALTTAVDSVPVEWMVAAALWTVWAVALFGRVAREQMPSHLSLRTLYSSRSGRSTAAPVLAAAGSSPERPPLPVASD